MKWKPTTHRTSGPNEGGGSAWETEAWVADNPSHMIHFNGSKFLGPYPDSEN
ncbi:BsuBI/PstI family type II restriction endonuclease [Propionibacterium freudenreichii]|uniref:BsuBI/PstI family type II restriction endonuclease n=1 Tax=Propionibacterium freudenreichii TaxID=1744 RepID=UPI0021A57B14|nr:BsuBI/PstI family type II restriction endonuclease [Propionibacterium freudenreichii]